MSPGYIQVLDGHKHIKTLVRLDRRLFILPHGSENISDVDVSAGHPWVIRSENVLGSLALYGARLNNRGCACVGQRTGGR
jgi:hypothetical protein